MDYTLTKQILLSTNMKEGGNKWPGKGMSEEGEGYVSHPLAEEIIWLAYINKLVGRTTLLKGQVHGLEKLSREGK